MTIDSVEDLTPKAFMELVAKLEPFFSPRKSAGGSGWQFNVENRGGWGDVLTEDSHEGDFGEWGFVLGDASEDGFLLFARDEANTKVAEVFLLPDRVAMSLSSADAPTVSINRSTHNLEVDFGSAADSMLVKDHNGAAIFRIDDDGSVHIPTGTSVVADL